MLVRETASYMEELDALVANIAQEPMEIMLVDDCGEWARDNGISVANPSPRAMAVRRTSDGRAYVVMRRVYEDEHIEQQASALLVAGWKDQALEVKEPGLFLRFLVLHELAHLLNDWGQEHEQDCNKWAFRVLGWTDES